MTRLVKEDVLHIKSQIQAYDALFKQQTGKTLEEIARIAADCTAQPACEKAAVIPVTSGEGIIGGFSEAEAAILSHCGIDTVVTEHSDIAGLQEAYLSGRRIAFLADDDAYIALGLGARACSDNGDATGRGYMAALLETMKLRRMDTGQERILILGAGPVGRAAAAYAAAHQASAVLYDPITDKARRAAAAVGAEYLEQAPNYTDFTCIMDASTAGDIIGVSDVTPDTLIAAAGMPCAVTAEAREKATVIHNPLELGTLTMYFQCLKQLGE